MKALVGYTGFVGSNLDGETFFEGRYNSRNIQEAYGTNPDLLVYAGLPAEKYLANRFPEQDKAKILQAEDNIRKIAPQKLVLISTIDVFQNPVDVDEDSVIDVNGLQTYGLHRYLLEQWVQDHYPDALIIRLPALFGKNLKKNFIYDYINQIPFALQAQKFAELSQKDNALQRCYALKENGFYQCIVTDKGERKLLRKKFETLQFSALNFTDSRSTYQFYPLSRLWKDICTALEKNLRLFHPATEPISAHDLYFYLKNEEFLNEINDTPACYDYHTKYASLFNRDGPYIMNYIEVMQTIKAFVLEMERENK